MPFDDFSLKYYFNEQMIPQGYEWLGPVIPKIQFKIAIQIRFCRGTVNYFLPLYQLRTNRLVSGKDLLSTAMRFSPSGSLRLRSFSIGSVDLGMIFFLPSRIESRDICKRRRGNQRLRTKLEVMVS